MIISFEIQGFKCFVKQRVELARISVLCGVNGAGKSSFLQALLLAHLARPRQRHVQLNGPLGLRLGQALDVLRSTEARLTASTGLTESVWRLSSEAEDALVLYVDESPDNPPSELGAGLIYLEAERLGPRDLLSVDSSPGDAVRLGSRGEFVAQLLESKGGRLQVREALRHGAAGDATLPRQTEAWLRELVPGVELLADSYPKLSAASVRFRRSGHGSEWLRAQNIGFGLSYVLPIIVAGLTAGRGGMVVVENPEAHLHPRAQSTLARFLGRVAAADTQVIVETHSDHFLNGLRLACVSQDPISCDDTAVHYFSCSEGGVQVERIRITEKGSLSSAPIGFFDQSERDLAAILKERRRD